ncbi:MAG: nitrogenase cofactor biosynthesis protein NifB [Candidatus Methanomethylophilaceae archaeon]|nr:nitrogenase cofactor biosynthesis protein NifB [Candidatus Methanomethylophilaceae archaeon]
MKALAEHPCFSEDAHRKFARMHVPVAPRCNIQCNYCNRKYDCSNESRPGVTSEVLSPEAAVEKIRLVKSRIPELKVIGIAGPGDPLANENTFRTLELVRDEFPDLTLCISTNGLALPENAERLKSLGVGFVTVTMNAVDPEIGAEVYEFVVADGRKHTGAEGARILLEKQLEGVRRCVDLGMVVKINVVMVPGINDAHIPDLVKKVKSMGAYMVNILPLIPVEGTAFADMRAPTPEERKALMDECSLDVRMMRHCRHCRADAIGLLGEDRSQEFVNIGGCSSGCGPGPQMVSLEGTRDSTKIAVASTDGANIDSGFGNAKRFVLYRSSGGALERIGETAVDGKDDVAGEGHRRHIESIVSSLGDCGCVAVSEIGPMPAKVLRNLGIRVVIGSGPIEEVLRSRDP